MPDPILMMKAVVVAAAIAAGVLLLSGTPRRQPRRVVLALGWVVGVGAAFYAGCWILGLRPDWPAREDQDRFLLLLMPAVLAVELVAAFEAMPRRVVWLLRVVVAASAGRLLLHGTGYLTDLAGPGSRAWGTIQAAAILGGLGLALAGAWVLLAHLSTRAPSRALPFALAMANGGAAIAIMLSGYATGGQPGLALAAALGGATAASLLLTSGSPSSAPLGIGYVGLFALLVSAHYFSELRGLHAVLLFAAPLLAWVAMAPPFRRWRPGLRVLAQLVLVSVPILITLVQAQRAFVRDYAPSSHGDDVSISDYAVYGR